MEDVDHIGCAFGNDKELTVGAECQRGGARIGIAQVARGVGNGYHLTAVTKSEAADVSIAARIQNVQQV